MTVRDVCERLEAEIVVPGEHLDESVRCTGASDILSDVVARGCAGMLLLTSQANPHTIRACALSEIMAILVTQGRHLEPETLEEARSKGITLARTDQGLYAVCGRLFSSGIPAASCL